jgi:hypothetical protein
MELTTEQKLEVREAQYAVVRASEGVRIAQDNVVKTVKDIAKSLRLSEQNLMFDMDTLEFKVKTPVIEGRPKPLE